MGEPTYVVSFDEGTLWTYDPRAGAFRVVHPGFDPEGLRIAAVEFRRVAATARRAGLPEARLVTLAPDRRTVVTRVAERFASHRFGASGAHVARARFG